MENVRARILIGLLLMTWLLLSGCNPHGEESEIAIIDGGFGVTIKRASTQPATAFTFPIAFDVTFDVPINPATFTAADIIQNGTAVGITWNIIQGANASQFTLTATASGEGTLIPSLAAGSIETDNRRSNAISVGVNNTVLFDATSPSVVSITSSSANTCYLVGQSIAIDITFTEAVFVTTGGGTPTILMETGAIDQAAAYTSGSGTSVLTFTYTVMAGDSSADLDYVSSAALTTNGGSIRDQAANNAILTLPTVGGGQSLGSSKDLSLPSPDTAAPTTVINSPSAITLNWTAVGGSTAGYRLASAVGGTAPANCGGGLDLGTGLTNQFTNLILNTQYSYRLCTYDSCNNDSPGVTVSATTARLAFNNLTTANGLPLDSLLDVYVHSNDDIQVSTNNGGWGLSTDGGTTWTNRTTADGLGNDITQFSGRDSLGNIFVSTNSGVSISTDGGTTFTNRNDTDGLGGGLGGLGNISLSSQVDSSDNIVASTLNGVSISSDLGVSWTNRTTVDGLPNNFILHTFVNAANNLYASTTGGGLAVSTNAGVSWTVHNVAAATGFPNDNANSSFANAAGTTIYVGTNGGLAVSTDSGASWITRTTAEGLPTNTTGQIVEDGNGYLYVATTSGLAVSTDSGASWDTYLIADGLGNNSVQGIAVDSNGVIYVATTGGLSISTTPAR